jgi:hypothetical protein
MTKKEMKKLMEGGKLVMGGTCSMLPLKECNAVVVRDENKVSHDDICKCPLYSYFTQSGHQDMGQVFLFILETEEGNQKSKIGQIQHLRLVRSKEKEAEESRSIMTKKEMKVLQSVVNTMNGRGEAKLEDGKLILGGECYALPLKVCSAIVLHDEVKMNQRCSASNGKCKCPLHSHFTQVVKEAAKEAGDWDAQVNGQASLLALKTGEGSIGGIKIQELVH